MGATPENNMLFKEIHWAYPSSIMAARYHRKKQGCYYTINNQVPLMGQIETFNEAKELADGLPEAYSPYTFVPANLILVNHKYIEKK